MAFKYIIPLLLLSGSQAAKQLKGNTARDQRSLLNTFPFNADQADHDAHHGEHGEHHEHVEQPARVVPSANLAPRDSLQGDGAFSFAAVAASSVGADGKRCVDKVEMVEETVYDDAITCDHSYDKRCHTTYVTTYESQQEEECDENFRKNCFIEYEQIAITETVKICRRPLVKDCSIRAPEVCTTQYESECWTKQEEHDVEDDVVSCETVYEEKCEEETNGYTSNSKCTKWPKEECSVSKQQVKKYSPITGCTKEPVTLCDDDGRCGFSEGDEQCYDKQQTIVQDVPKEQCTLEPQRTCKHVTKLVPKLEPKEECVDVPKEVCTRSRTNPRKVKKPVVKKWCYVPSEESGLN